MIYCRNLDGSTWLEKEELQNFIIEDITDRQYVNFVTMMDRLAAHPYSYECKDFIFRYRKQLRTDQKDREITEPKIGADGRRYVTSYGNLKKECLPQLHRTNIKCALCFQNVVSNHVEPMLLSLNRVSLVLCFCFY